MIKMTQQRNRKANVKNNAARVGIALVILLLLVIFFTLPSVKMIFAKIHIPATLSSGGGGSLTAVPDPYTYLYDVIDIGENTLASSSIQGGTSPYQGNLTFFPEHTTGILPTNTVPVPIPSGFFIVDINATSEHSLNLTFEGTSYYDNTIGSNTIEGNWIISALVTDKKDDDVVMSNGFTIDEFLGTPSITPNSAVNVMPGQPLDIVATLPSNQLGTTPYTYNFLVINTVTKDVIANELYTDVASPANTFIFNELTTGTYEANVKIVDSASLPEVSNSIYSGVITVAASSTTSTSSTTSSTSSTSSTSTSTTSTVEEATLTLSNTMIDQGQGILFTATVPTGSTSPFTYNFEIVNSITNKIIANQLYKSVTLLSNSFFWLPPATDLGNTLKANAIITPSSGTVMNTVYMPIGFNSAPSIGLMASNEPIDSGQLEFYTIEELGGTGPFNVELYNITKSAKQGTNEIVSVGGTNSFSILVTSSTLSNSFEYNVIAYDSGITTPFVFNSANVTVTVNEILGTPTITNPNSTIAADSSEPFSVTIPLSMQGSSPYSYNFLIYNSVTNVILKDQHNNKLASTTNTFTWSIPIVDAGNTVRANIIIKDAANVYSNSIPTLVITITNSTYGTTTSTTTISGGGTGGGGGGGGGGGSSKPVITPVPNGYSVNTIAQLNSFNVTLDGLPIKVVDNYITPTSSGFTINNASYDLNLSEQVQIANTPDFTYFVNLTQLNYTPILNTVTLYISAVSNNNSSQNTSVSGPALNLTVDLSNYSVSSVSSAGTSGVIIQNINSSTPNATSPYLKIAAFKLILPSNYSFANVSLPFKCNANYTSITPFELENESWYPVNYKYLNSSGCSLLLNIQANETIGIFTKSSTQNATSTTTSISTTTTSYQTTTAQKSSSGITLPPLTDYLIPVLGIIAAVAIIAMYLKLKSKKSPQMPRTPEPVAEPVQKPDLPPQPPPRLQEGYIITPPQQMQEEKKEPVQNTQKSNEDTIAKQNEMNAELIAGESLEELQKKAEEEILREQQEIHEPDAEIKEEKKPEPQEEQVFTPPETKAEPVVTKEETAPQVDAPLPMQKGKQKTPAKEKPKKKKKKEVVEEKLADTKETSDTTEEENKTSETEKEEENKPTETKKDENKSAYQNVDKEFKMFKKKKKNDDESIFD